FYICGALLATIVATAASWVLTSYYFSQVPLMFLPTNLLLLPSLPFYLSAAAVFVCLLTLGVEVRWLGMTLDYCYEKMLHVVEWMSNGTEFVIDYQIPLWGVALWLLMLAGCAYALNKNEKK
ncbi:MAG: ComEC/Rec2 family competence protein, partial [Muribaculaceae bacterium]|nr:ComEC/Rec2 family competence protein [Muribaculaceae bacterium]